jgi:cathepsin F
LTFLAHHGKAYATIQEFEYRFKLFAETDNQIKQFNSQPQTSTVGHNKLSDWSIEERKRLTSNISLLRTRNSPVAILDTNDLPTEVNWIEKGAVNEVQDQG